MGRNRTFDTAEVLASARVAFERSGYHGTSIGDLLSATGIQRASLYQAFGSKRGVFLAALKAEPTMDLLLVALMDLAAEDPEVRSVCRDALADAEDPAQVLGRQLLLRSGLR
ncbi:helix-turn-helix domain-containing protein [Corynebacterium heidelbergense]|uniref:HTH tetR-type domain-containing protein n=1 Tax=Corynebacterium heidelbergense TaxID=2055947 RepID=A0A364V861_9CORY|nr:helix-turn-helix domain-containing protein [Corynebacterium heidelbergense]RAV32853.1 hypothetical protein DLJ54_01310 [Corynebacterium heidelbergense]